MASIPYMPLYIADYMADAAHLSTLEHGAYMLLIMTYWQRGKPLPSSDERLANVARMSKEHWLLVKPVLQEFFIDDGTFWNHKRIDAELSRFRDKSAKASAAGKASAERRLNERSTAAARTRNHTDTDTDTEEDSSEAKASSLPPANQTKPARQKSGRKPGISLEELSVNHIAEWLAEKRSQGKYLNHDELFVVEYFKNYCTSRGRRYDDYVAALRNAFTWKECEPKPENHRGNKDERSKAAVLAGLQQYRASAGS